MSNKSNFVHLHVHSEYSILAATCRIKDLVSKAAEYQMPALAVTDFGNMFGCIEFYQACQRQGIKPIIGSDIYVAPESRFDRATHGLRDASHPLVLLCESNEGYHNLVKLISFGYTEGFYYKPRVDKELLRKYSKGLIALSGSISSEIPHLININQIKKAKEVADEYVDIFGKNNFYLEIQDTKLRDQDKVNQQIIEIANEKNIPLIATNNVLYMNPNDSEALEAAYCVQGQHTLQSEGRIRVYTNQNYFKSQEEIISSFKDYPEAIENTAKVADRCNVEIDFKTVHLPHFETPDKLSAKDYLRKLTLEGAKDRYEKVAGEVEERIDHELKVISDLGYDAYFLIVWDFVRFAIENQIPVGPGRGSAAGSIVSYCLGITNLDPLKYNLLFERFLNPQRISMPDIDIDFCFERRGEVIDYVTQKYTKDHVAQIITFGTMMARGVVRDVGRVLGIPYAEVDRVAKLIPNELKITLKSALEQEQQLRDLIKQSPQISQLFSLAQLLEGLPRHASTHAAGVVISGKPLTENVPLFKTADDQISTQYPMTSLESLNILKMDFLGLRTLTVIDDCVKIIKRIHKKDIDIRNVPFDDPKTFKDLSKALAIGVFQLESSGMRDILSKLKPDKFEDLIAVLALYRPGPIGSGMVDDFINRKSGKVKFKYDHPLLEPILEETYGIMVYQEQIMKIVSSLAKFSLAQADTLRRAIGKKKQEVIEEQKKVFVDGCVKNDISEAIAGKIFDLIMHFAGYGFNKSHSAAYAVISYQTAYLKSNYPTAFMTALLSSEKDNTDKVVQYIDEARDMDIQVLPPDVNESFPRFTVVGDSIIRFGLAAVKNVGQAAIDSIIQSRIKLGSFENLYDFCEKVDTRVVNRKTIESLIKCGAFDSMHKNRAQLLEALDFALSHASQIQKDRQVGQMSLFDESNGSSGFGSTTQELPPTEEWSSAQKLAFEKELLGFYVTGHPLDEYQDDFKQFSELDSSGLKDVLDGKEIMIGTLVAKLRHAVTKKKGERMAILSLEDLFGNFDALVFPRVFSEYGHHLDVDKILFFKGRVDKSEDKPKLIVSEIHTVEAIQSKVIRSVIIELKEEMSSENTLHQIRDVLNKYSGETPVYINAWNEGRRNEMIIDRSLYVRPSRDFVGAMEKVVGEGKVHLQVKT